MCKRAIPKDLLQANYHKAGGTISEKRYFAVKELRKQTEILGNSEPEPDRETTAYKYLNCRRHPHIIQLLATFTQKGHLNMIFPWADGNLHEFWQSHFPKTSDLTRDASLARWMMGQFLGLAEAICCIHHSEALDLPEYNDVCRDRSKTNGRHGDIKPENILWFKSGSSRPLTQSLGKLLISDLGSTEFHATRSKTIQAEAAGGFTHTYRAPEFDRVERVAPKADIWSFGCVLLQFLVWYMHGWDRVDSFAQARSNDSNLNYHADHFFNFDQSDSTVVIKASVTTVHIDTFMPSHSTNVTVDVPIAPRSITRTRFCPRSLRLRGDSPPRTRLI
jgi:serine/threonine protein kinase